MIARFRVLLSFPISVRQQDDLRPHQFDHKGYGIRIFPPYQAASDPSRVSIDSMMAEALRPADPQSPVETIRMDSSATIQTNCLQIHFLKASFDRKERTQQDPTPIDPPVAFLFEVANGLLNRYRSAGRAPLVRPVTPEGNIWQLRYLDDDEKELSGDPTLIHGYGVTRFAVRVSGLNRSIWDETWTLPIDFKIHAWESLLLDSEALLPEIGPSIVVAYSALETFITWTLDQLVVRKGLPAELWDWINDRGPGRHEKEPSVVEQFDVLLKVLAGKSLKEDNKLWEQFHALRKVRNNFGHEGKATLGERELTVADAFQHIAQAKAIVDWVENLLPSDLRRPSVAPIEWNIAMIL